MQMHKLMIAVEGADKAGKHTQVMNILNYLRELGFDAETLDFPQYKSATGQKIKKYLNGEMGKIEDLNPREIMKLYADDRLSHQDILNDWLKAGKIVILDRYSYSNAFGLAKMPQSKWVTELRWLEHMEFTEYGLIRPNHNIYLYLDPKISFAMKNRGLKEYQNGQADIHESNFKLLYNVSKVYNFIASQDPKNWTIINEMKPIEEKKDLNDIRYNEQEIFNKLKPVINGLISKNR